MQAIKVKKAQTKVLATRICSCVFPQQQHFATGSLAQISAGAIRCSFNTRFWARFWRVQKVTEGSVQVQARIHTRRFRKVLDGFGAEPT